MNIQIPLITVLGPTAVGKTTFAAHLALALDAEIISADSRQVFRGMDIGTGKDLADYSIGDKHVPYHLIDIAESGSEYSVYQFQTDFRAACSAIVSRGRTPLLCGGTGFYIESVLQGYQLTESPVNPKLRLELSEKTDEELIAMLSKLRILHNTTDILDRERLIRAIEIEIYKKHPEINPVSDFLESPVFGLTFERSVVRQRITERLRQRLENGMVNEVQRLMDRGVSSQRLKMYGLEYKYISMFIEGELDYNEMFELLNTAIHQFAKRQMTWFRRMEKTGIKINWIDGENGLEYNLAKALAEIKLWRDKKNISC